MIKNLLLSLTAIAFPLIILAPAVTVHAVDPVNKSICDEAPDSAVCKDMDVGGQNPLFGPQGFLTKIINLLSIIVGIVAVIMIIIAGLRFITSGSNPQDVSNARERVVYAIVALIVAAFAQVMVRFIIGKA